MWPIFGGLLWSWLEPEDKFSTTTYSFREYRRVTAWSLPVITSNIVSFRRRITVRGNDLLAIFSCEGEALPKDFHMDSSFNH
jgi:hypothetical protein